MFEEIFSKNFSEFLSREKIQEIVDHPEKYDKEYYVKVFQMALEQGITKTS